MFVGACVAGMSSLEEVTQPLDQATEKFRGASGVFA
jgi:hypothetical protein